MIGSQGKAARNTIGTTLKQLCYLGMVAMLGMSPSGCKKKKKDPIAEARQLKSCGGSGHCTGPNICVKDDDGSGTCVHPCKGPDGCFKGFSCTGNYVRAYGKVKMTYSSKPYCQKASIPMGGKCGGVAKTCQLGSACFQGKCFKTCTKTGTCEGDHKCVEVVRKGKRMLPWLKKKPMYKACLTATVGRGDKCTAGKLPLCKPGNECLGGRCMALCKKNDECAKGQKCHPVKVTETKMLGKFKRKLFDACQVATLGAGGACKKDHWPLCERGFRCLRGKCAKLCQKTTDCGTTGKCLAITQSYGVLKDKKRTLYRACVPATIAEGGTCGGKIFHVCQQKHRCVKGRCVRWCVKHETCAEGKACSGRGFYPKNRNKEILARATGARADFYFCQSGHRKFAPRATYNKCKGGRDCLPKHVCVRKKCRPMCESADNCPKHFGVRPPCKSVVSKSRKKRWKVCLGLL